jgi:hypothetical protein
MVEATGGSNPRFINGVAYRFVRLEGHAFPSHRCLIPASEYHISGRSGSLVRRKVMCEESKAISQRGISYL